MGRTLLNNISPWVMFLLLACIIVSFAFLIRFISRHFFPQYVIKKADKIGLYVSILITGEAILIAFTIIVLWQTYTATKQYVSQEASELAKMLVHSHNLSLKDQAIIIPGIRNYIKLVREEEWPYMRIGKRSDNSQQAFENLFALLGKISPTTDKEKIYYREMLGSLNELLEARRFRLERVESNIPLVLLSVIIISSLTLITLLALVEEKEEGVTNGLVYVVSAILALYLSLILLLDYPFSGDIAVGNKPFTQGILGHP
jgi:hypothetical protein